VSRASLHCLRRPIAATLALGTVAVEPGRAWDGGVHIWLDPELKALRGPDESYSDVILRLVKSEALFF
jgi:hypothetical protein